jgi:hypothetical protein
MKRCAALLEIDQATNKEYWRIIRDPTIGDIRRLRQRGAIIMRQIVERHGNEVTKTWVVDSGLPVVCSVHYLKESFSW